MPRSDANVVRSPIVAVEVEFPGAVMDLCNDAKMGQRDCVFTASEWRQFGTWLNYIDRGLSLAYEMAQSGAKETRDLGVSESVTGVRWYATDLSLLDSLVYRAAGRRRLETICYDVELSGLCDELEKSHPKLRDLRNALFAHPPFLDELIERDEALFFTTEGIHITSAEGGSVDTIVNPFLDHMELPPIIERVRAIFGNRLKSAEASEATGADDHVG